MTFHAVIYGEIILEFFRERTQIGHAPDFRTIEPSDDNRVELAVSLGPGKEETLVRSHEPAPICISRALCPGGPFFCRPVNVLRCLRKSLRPSGHLPHSPPSTFCLAIDRLDNQYLVVIAEVKPFRGDEGSCCRTALL